jgi:polyferredoxin
MKWLAIAGIWTLAMLLWASTYLDYSDFRLLGVIYPVGLWAIGITVILVAGLVSGRRRRRSQKEPPSPDASPAP